MVNKNFAEGIAIISKYVDPDNYDVHGEHDQIWFGDYRKVTDEKDISMLLELGWFEDGEGWSCFT